VRRPAALALIFLLATSFAPAADRIAPIRSEPILLDPSEPGRRSVGALRWLGGWRLTSPQPRFGGISSLARIDGGFLALSDEGVAIRFRIGGDGSIGEGDFAPLPEGPPNRLVRAKLDSESMAIDPADGRIWIGFEGANAIWRYAPGLARAEAHAEPEGMRGWPGNSGPEAMARLADGRFIVIGEAKRGDGAAEAFLFPRDPTAPGATPIRFYYRPPKGFAATDAATLPDGSVLVLNRYYSLLGGVKAALSVIDPAEIATMKVVEGRELARLAPPLSVDNMEALAVERDGARTIIWIASDDNFNPMQRTLLMKFALAE
jgi:hypothetical protein